MAIDEDLFEDDVQAEEGAVKEEEDVDESDEDAYYPNLETVGRDDPEEVLAGPGVETDEESVDEDDDDLL